MRRGFRPIRAATVAGCERQAYDLTLFAKPAKNASPKGAVDAAIQLDVDPVAISPKPVSQIWERRIDRGLNVLVGTSDSAGNRKLGSAAVDQSTPSKLWTMLCKRKSPLLCLRYP